VLEPLGAYLLLATSLADNPTGYSHAYNIGPEKEDMLTVEQLTKIAIQSMGKGSYEVQEDKNKLHEAGMLMLSIEQIKKELNWKPIWNAQQAIEKTVQWYIDNNEATVKCLNQLNEYWSSEK
jgi:CDP-glucose 4,6-dehydratase